MKLEDVRKIEEVHGRSGILPIEIRYKCPGGRVIQSYNPEDGTWRRSYKSLAVPRGLVGRYNHIVTKGSVIAFDKITEEYAGRFSRGVMTRLGYYHALDSIKVLEFLEEFTYRSRPYVEVAYGLDRNWTSVGMEHIDHRIEDILSITLLKHDRVEMPLPLRERIEMRWFGDSTITVPGYFMGLDKTSIKIARYLDENSEPRKIEEFPVKEIGDIHLRVLKPVELEEALRIIQRPPTV